MDYSTDNLIAFLKECPVRGYLNPAAARARVNAADMLLALASDDERADLRTLDIEQLCARTYKLEGSSIRPETLQLYRERLEAAIADFVRYHDAGESGFEATRGETHELRKRCGNNEPIPKGEVDLAREHFELNKPKRPGAIVPVAIRDGHTVFLHNLPGDLSAAEAEQIANIARAFVRPNA